MAFLRLFDSFRQFSRTILFFLLLVSSISAVDPVNFVRTDIRVSFLYEEKERIDWPLIFYLNTDLGYRVDLVHITLRDRYSVLHTGTAERQLFLHHLYLPAIAPAYFDSSLNQLFADRRPDIVIVGETPGSLLYEAFVAHLVKFPADANRLFNIRHIFRLAESKPQDSIAGQAVSFNRQELVTRFRDRMNMEVSDLLPGTDVSRYKWAQLGRYELIKRADTTNRTMPDFASGIPPLRLEQIFATRIPAGPMRESYLKKVAAFVRNMDIASTTKGKERTQSVLRGYKELLFLSKERSTLASLEKIPDFRPYVVDFLSKAERAALETAGLDWDGEVIVRPSPEGPKLKFRAALSANGPQAIELQSITFYPYWDTARVILDSLPHQIAPHGSFVREYLVDIDRAKLEAQKAESLSFVTAVLCDEIELELHNSLPIWEKPNLNVTFTPDYLFMPQVTRTEADKIVHPLSVRVQITKPESLTGNAGISLEVPSGMFAGAYKQSIPLTMGMTHEYVQIPFSVSNLFELGIHHATVSLTMNGTKIATDSVRLRIAECRIPPTRKIAFLPDTSGRLEDVLHMTYAAIEPLTDRSLITAELDAYDVLVFGSGSHRLHPSLNKAKDGLEGFLRNGGSIVLFGQPADFPDGFLPVTISPAMILLDRDGVTNRIPESKLLSTPYPITEQDLLSSFVKRREVSAAVVSPAELVYAGPNGEALLSVSRIGKGQVIYCGLPLLELVGTLQIDAIHLFANIMNY